MINPCTYQTPMVPRAGGAVVGAMLLLILLLGSAGLSKSWAQVRDSAAVQADTTDLQPARTDSLRESAPPAAATGGPAQSGQLREGEVRFQAADSLVFDFRGDRVANLYGSAKVNHQSGQLESGKVTLNLDSTTVRANTQTPQDTLSQPVLTRQGQPPIRSQRIAFNYRTEKGRFDVARVEIDRGKITGTKVKNVSPHVVYLEDAIYSTCTLDHPHYYIKMDQAKIVKHGDNQEVFFKNARLYLLDIPYPLVFPFGYFPGNMERRQSGILEPTYVFQNTSTRGLGLRNLGWFQYFNDYIVGQASVDIFTSGTFYLTGSTTYRKRGSFNGSIDIGYSRERGLEPTDPDFSIETQKSISLTHSQEFSPYSRLSANINLRTADYYRRNSYDIDERVQTTTRSSINYQYRHPDNLYNFNASIRQNRDFRSNTTRISGPSMNFSLRRLTPFADDTRSNEQSRWYESLSVKYGNSFQSNFTYNPTAGDSAEVNWLEALFDPEKYREATGNNDHYKYGFRQDLDLSLNNLLNSRFLNLSANADYTEYWLPGYTDYFYNPVTQQDESRQVKEFKTAREFSTSLNFTTTFYGISNAQIGNIEGFRHTVRPSVALSYRPDFSSDFFGYYQRVQVDSTGRTRQFSIFSNEVFRGPSAGEQRAINFGISNVFEAKQVKRDSTGEKSEEVLRLIDQLNISSSYNFAADSLRLSNLNTSLTSSIVDGLSLRASADFNFYERDSNGLRINKFLLANSGRLAEMTNFSVSASTSFSGGESIRVDETPHFPARYDPLNQSLFADMDPYFNSRPVQPIQSPWSVSVNFRYNWNLNPNGENRKSATINAQNIQFQLTPKWSFSTRIGYDFIQQRLTPSQFNLTRQLHEWTLSFQMNPFGDFQYYFFRLSLNSSQLQSIFQKLPLLKNLERSSSPSGRGLSRY